MTDSINFDFMLDFDSKMPATPKPQLFNLVPATPDPSLNTPNTDRFEAFILNEDNNILISSKSLPSAWMRRPTVNPPLPTSSNLPKRKMSTIHSKKQAKMSFEIPLPMDDLPKIKKLFPSLDPPISPISSPSACAPSKKIIKRKQKQSLHPEPLLSKRTIMNLQEEEIFPPPVIISSSFKTEESLLSASKNKPSACAPSKKIKMSVPPSSVPLNEKKVPHPPSSVPDVPRKSNLKMLNTELRNLLKVKRNLFKKSPPYKLKEISYDFEGMKKQRKERMQLYLQSFNLRPPKHSIQMQKFIKHLRRPSDLPANKNLKLNDLKRRINLQYKLIKSQPIEENVFSLHPSAIDYLEMTKWATSFEEINDYFNMALGICSP